MGRRSRFFSGLYYDSILAELKQAVRQDLPELTDETPDGIVQQLLSAIAASHHTSSALIDHVAEETSIESAKLRSSMKSLGRLVGYRVKEATPATADVILRLTAPVGSTAQTVSQGLKVATSGSAKIEYEIDESLVLQDTDVTTVVEYDASGPTYTQRSGAFVPWGTPAVGDAIYFGNEQVMFDALDFQHSGVGSVFTSSAHYVWEYRDVGLERVTPDAVTPAVSTITVNLTSFLGATRRSGSEVVVVCLRTGVSETVTTTWSGGLNVAVTSSLLGQVSGSPLAGDYEVYGVWRELPDVAETDRAARREVRFSLPETTTRSWESVEVDGVEAYWIRLRVIQASATSPTVDGGDASVRNQYVTRSVTQGTTFEDNPAGSTTGVAGQYFVTSRDRVLEGSPRLFVTEGTVELEYVAADDFSGATSASRVAALDYDDDGRAIFMLGDGVRGNLPASGADNVRLSYRRGGDSDGNVGAREISRLVGGSNVCNLVYNPRPATGWAAAQGSTDESLDALRETIPASVRAHARIVTVSDLAQAATTFVASTGASPVARTFAVENGAGPKTVLVYVAGADGNAVSAGFRAEFEEYLNGDPIEGTGGALMMNVTALVENFAYQTVDVTAEIVGGSTTKAAAALTEYLGASSRKSDGTYNHLPGDTIYLSKLVAVVHAADPAIESVTITGPASDVVLATGELPFAGTVTVTEA